MTVCNVWSLFVGRAAREPSEEVQDCGWNSREIRGRTQGRETEIPERCKFNT